MDFRLLGPVEVRVDGQPIALGPRQQRLVTAVLALEVNRLVTVDRLVDVIWPTSPPRTAVHAVQVCVSRLRRVLAEAGGDNAAVEIVGRDTGYSLRTDPMRVDAHRFRALVMRAKGAEDEMAAAGLLSEALGLWSGRALTGVAHEPVRDKLCRGLEEARLVATEDLLEIRLRLGGHRELLDELSDLVAAHPLRDRLVGHLMLALHRSGRRGAALELYRQTKKRLSDELGLDPANALQDLELAILRADPDLDVTRPPAPDRHRTTAPPVPAQLPPAVAAFAGRTSELGQLNDVLTDTESSPRTLIITAIGGTAGVGKTTLALHWAHQVAERFPDGQLYVNLRGFGPGGPPVAAEEAVRGFLEALGVPVERIPGSLDAQVGLYRSLLAGKRTLVLLDNAATVEQVRPLLPGSPPCVVVVTSRTQLIGLIAGEGARLVTLDVLTAVESQEMLARRLGRARVEGDQRSLDEIIRWCARLPLALAVVAARAAAHPQFSLSDLADGLRRAGDGLDSFAGVDPMTDVRVVLSWSYRSLDGDSARLFRLLALHPGPDVTAPAAASLAGELDLPVQPRLAELVRAHLLMEHRPGRYICHDLLRAYSLELVRTHDTDAQRYAAARRVLDYYLYSAFAADRMLSPYSRPLTLAPTPPGVTPEVFADQSQARVWFSSEHAALMGAVDLARQSGFDIHTWQVARTLTSFLDLRGEWSALAAIQTAAVEAAIRLGDLPAQAFAHRVLGRAHTQLGNHHDAAAHQRSALNLFEQLADLTSQAFTIMDLGWLLGQQDLHQDALDHAYRALELFRSANNSFGEALALNGAGFCQGRLGNHQLALELCEQALVRFQELGDRAAEADTWDSLGCSHDHLADHAQAVRCFEMALDAYREIGDRYREAETLDHLADSYHGAGDVTLARDAWHQAISILAELNHLDVDRVRAKLHKP